MFKKITCFIVACLIFVFNVSAKEIFYVYGKDDAKLAETLNMTEAQLKEYCEQGSIAYLAVNPDNTKQIRLTEIADSFSKQIFDLSVLSDSEILELCEELSGFGNASGEIIVYNGSKFLKIELETEDSGGKYVLTQYITVENAQKKVLTFYTDADTDREYIETVFEQQFKADTNYLPFIIAGVILFAVLGIIILIFILKDLKKDKG